MLLSIPIPKGSSCLLKVNQEVEFGVPFVKKSVRKDISIEVSKYLDVSPSKIFNHLKKFVGEPVKKGEVIAVKKGVFSTKKMISEYEGVLKEIDHANGQIIITATQTSKDTLFTYFKGEVSEIKNNLLKLKVKSGKEYKLKDTGADFGGEVSYDNNNSTMELNSKVIVAESLTPFLETKLEAIGVAGFVTLKPMSDSVSLPVAQLKNADDFKEILKSHLSYCLVSKEYSTIYFYE